MLPIASITTNSPDCLNESNSGCFNAPRRIVASHLGNRHNLDLMSFVGDGAGCVVGVDGEVVAVGGGLGGFDEGGEFATEGFGVADCWHFALSDHLSGRDNPSNPHNLRLKEMGMG